MNRELLKNIGIYAAIVAFFVVLSYAFVPQVLSGKIVNQSDISGWRGMAEESVQWNNAHPDDKTAWSDSMFGGMPNVTFIDDFKGDWTKPLYNALLWGKRPASYIFIALLGAFLMMLAMGVNRFLAIAGAVAVAFCAYNFQIIQVGHNTKMQAIAFAPWAIAAMIFTYRAALGELARCSAQQKCVGKKWLALSALGSALFALALSFQIKANHVQITYYLALVILIYGIATLIWVLVQRNRELFMRFACASALLLFFGIIGIGTNANKLIPTYAYTPYTMRGGSELSGASNNGKGLDLDYATAWSYGIEETPNLMIPNYNGGSSSGSLGEKSATYQLFKSAGQNARQICKSLPLYWGPQPFTAGPMYMGAISIFLFILGLCVLGGREKWWLLCSVVLAILLGWGSHFMWFTELWFNYAPMYNKFRTVSMALVILQFCLPLLGIYTLDRIVRQEIEARRVVCGTWIALGITAGFCALAGLFPAIAGDFVAASDAQMQDVVTDALQQDRRHMLQVDAWRSFILIMICGAGIVWCYMKPGAGVAAKRSRGVAVMIAVLVLFDMWSVGKRYLNSDHFTTPKAFGAQFQEREVDKMILEDKDPSYRVLDLSENTFNSSVTSFRHKSIGGYSPTKMQRYQDLIDHYLSREINSFYKAASSASTFEQMQEAVGYLPVLSMLNCRYVIIGGDYPPLVNPYAFGEAWFADSVVEASSADGEIELLGAADLRTRAVVRTEDAARLGVASDEGSDRFVAMTSYAPNELHYMYQCTAPSIAVFSEVFHPSWKAVLRREGQPDQPLDLIRANWILRAAALPAGEGEIVMRYEPADYAQGALVSLICSILLALCIAGLALFAFLRRHFWHQYH